MNEFSVNVGEPRDAASQFRKQLAQSKIGKGNIAANAEHEESICAGGNDPQGYIMAGVEISLVFPVDSPGMPPSIPSILPRSVDDIQWLLSSFQSPDVCNDLFNGQMR